MSFLRQALLVAVTAVIVGIIVPSYFKPSYPVPEIFGTVAPGFEEVREVFRKNYVDGWDNPEAGSAFSVYHKGEKVVDLWAGYADAEAKRLWREDTMSIIFSTTKGFTVACVAMLADRGLIDFTKPVAHYWPEFAQKGKEKITVQQLLEHEAGLSVIEEKLSFGLLKDRDAMDKILARSEPQWEPGTRHGYHAITIGPLVDALVRRVDPKKRTVGQFVEEEIRKPFGIDVYIGAPLTEYHRVGRLVNVKERLTDVIYTCIHTPFFRKYLIEKLFGRLEHNTAITDNCDEVCDFDRMADPDKLNIELASANGVATARAVAKFYGILANGGMYENKTLLSKKIIDEYINDRRGLTPDLVLFDLPMRWKYGMDLIPQPNEEGNLFGAPGYGGQMGYADPNNNLGIGFISRYMSPSAFKFEDQRIKSLYESVQRIVEKKKRT